MPLSVTCQCGKRLSVPEAMAGKRVRCPVCKQIVNVPAPEPEEVAVEEVASEPEPPEAPRDDQDEGEETPSRKKKKPPPEKKSKTMLFVLLGGGAVLLLSCCCFGSLAAWFFRSGPSDKVLGAPPVEEKGSWTKSDPKIAVGGQKLFGLKSPYKAYKIT